MAGFQDILGHELVREHLQKAIKYRRISHAYILSGERGIGKKSMAKAFAMTLFCEKGGEEPCMECHACKQLLSGNHPDCIWVQHEKPNSIGVDEIREQVNNTIGIKPYSSQWKLYIIDEAEKMTVQAQNALLKTIEEPPEYAILMLLTTNQELFLPTILSRCIQLKLWPLQDQLVSTYLVRKFGVAEEQAEVYAAFSRGILGRALDIAATDAFGDMIRDILNILKGIHQMDTAQMLDCVRHLVNDYPNLQEVLDLIQLWYRDILMFKVTKDMNGLTFKSEYSAVSRICSQSSYQGLEQILEAVDKAKVRLTANVNKELTLELLLMTMKES
ncbi:MAG: DNA polymerase III subunit delta' [Clostridium sp.]|nr:DNA polymerase III subunit delta' [Clostridium sp.]